MAATIKDVAKETNLAISTISKYMNGGNVRRENQILIEAAIKKLGYTPNNMARGLRTSRSYMIGLIAGPISNAHISNMVSQMGRKLRTKGYSLMYTSHEENIALANEYVDYLLEKGVDGIIATPIGQEADYLKHALEQKVPVVIVEESGSEIPTDCVQVDCTRGAYELVEHLAKEGHRKIAIIKGPREKLTSKERLRGYLRVHQDYEIPVKDEYLIDGDFSYEAGYEGIQKLWKLSDPPTAIFVTNYDACLGAMAAIHKLKIAVPNRLSIVSFDDLELSVMVRPKLTAVRQPLNELAESACDLLLQRMDGDYTDYPKKVRLKPMCIYRDSVQKPIKP